MALVRRDVLLEAKVRDIVDIAGVGDVANVANGIPKLADVCEFLICYRSLIPVSIISLAKGLSLLKSSGEKGITSISLLTEIVI